MLALDVKLTTDSDGYRRGVIYAVAAGICMSVAGLLVRLVDNADAWTILFYRSIAFVLTVLVFLYFRDGKKFYRRYRELGAIDVFVAVVIASGFVLFIQSLFHTSVANTVLILSTGPFLAALLGLAVLREAVSLVTWFAMLVAAIGVVIMVSGSESDTDLAGITFALLAVVAFAIMVVTMRYAGPERDNIAGVSLAGLIAGVFCLFVMPGFAISGRDLMVAVTLGCVQIGCGFILITLSARTVPAAQVPLYALGETALAPLWVWWLMDELPARETLIGGALVMLAVIVQAVIAWSRSEQPQPTPG